MTKPMVNSIPQPFPHDNITSTPDEAEDMPDNGMLDSPNISSHLTNIVMKQVDATVDKQSKAQAKKIAQREITSAEPLVKPDVAVVPCTAPEGYNTRP